MRPKSESRLETQTWSAQLGLLALPQASSKSA
jgi:hypothetical protein